MTVEEITARRLGNVINQICIRGVKSTAVNDDAGILYVSAWPLTNVRSAIIRAHDALVRTCTDRGDSTTWNVTTIIVKIVAGGPAPSRVGRVESGTENPSPIGTITSIDVRNLFNS